MKFSITLSNTKDFISIDGSDVYQFYFIEDIYSFVKTGKLIFRDSIGIVEFLPLVGGETVSVSYGSVIDDETNLDLIKEYSFVVHKVIDITKDGSNSKTVELLLVDREHYKLHNTSYSYSWKDAKYTDIIKHLLTKQCSVDVSDIVNWEDCIEDIGVFCTSLKSPAADIKWLMCRCSGSKSKTSGYLLYNNTEKSKRSFNLTTLDSLLSNTTLLDPQGKYQMTSDNYNYINNIQSVAYDKIDYSSINKLSNEVLLGYDIKRKKILRVEYNYNDVVSEYTILGDYTLFNGDVIIINAPNETLTAETDEKILNNMYKDNWIKQYCLQQTIDIIMVGSIERYAGGMIDIEWPSGDSDSVFDKNMMGKYLVKSITHQFVPSQQPLYTQRMVLIKNGYQGSDDDSITRSTKKNL